ncbi:MAG: phosphatase PAP2 family protein [Micavibrio sp.]|nr:phosphatase PAP2 family protein [Micavibrio sp.]
MTDTPETKKAPAHFFKPAWQAHREILVFGVVFSALSMVYTLLLGTPLAECIVLVYGLMGIFAAVYAFLGAAYGIIYLREFARCLHAQKNLIRAFLDAGDITGKRAGAYVSGPVFAYGMMGLVAILPVIFLLAYKSLVPFVHPYAWDQVFSSWDYALHFGHYPSEIIGSFIDSMNAGKVMDLTYGSWFVAMFGTCGFVLFIDRQVHRRMRFVWSFLLAWIIGGCLMAEWLSCVGPLFYHQFYPDMADIYKPLVDRLTRVDAEQGLAVFSHRQLIVDWTLNDRHIDPNTLAAMPSIHVWIAWLMMLYWREVSPRLFVLSLIFCTMIFMSTVYLGIHYAVDGYASIALMTPMWWIIGRLLDRRYSRIERLADAP